ncbi:MAG: EamA family transporter [Spirochaetaceae bacterium]|jgi:transporter family protein|nr:EamA family transporter [Spirochaetaceae bacterium]
MWIVYALLSALCAALASIFAKTGMENVNSTTATALRTLVVLVMTWAVVFITGKHHDIARIGGKSLLYALFSGAATGLSWLCYSKALQTGDASKVMPVDKFSLVIGMILAFTVLKETITVKAVIGALLITAGTFVLIR